MAVTNIIDLPTGLHRDIPAAVYHQRVLGLVSKGALDLMKRSPAHYKAWVDGHDEEPTPALLFGAAFHCALLEPAVFAATYVVEPAFGDCRKKDNKAARDEWRRGNAGKLFIEAEDMGRIAAMTKSVMSHPLAGRMIFDGDPELTVRWRDDEHGLECKARSDYYVRKHKMVVDVKSAHDASHDEFRLDAARFGYHRQEALYRRGFARVGTPIDHFLFVVVEKEEPFAVAIYDLDEASLTKGVESIDKNMSRLAKCLREGRWPAYDTSIQTLSLPKWAA